MKPPSYEFGTLIFLAVFGSLLSLFYAFTAPEEVLHDVYHGVDPPVHGPAVGQASDDVLERR